MNKKTINLIYNGISFKEILSTLNLEKYELLMLYEKLLVDDSLPFDVYSLLRKDYLDNCICFNINKQKVIIISDTHLGSIKERLDYLEQIKTFVNEEKSSILLHGGDIGDGLINNRGRYSTYDKQISHIEKNYLHFENTIQYILGGNHDKRYKQRNYDILRILSKEDPMIKPVGYYKAYFKIYNFIGTLEHNAYKKNFGYYEDIRILGHSHLGKFCDKKVYIPASCDENSSCYKNFNPGFLTMEAHNIGHDVELNFIQYKYTNNGPEYEDEYKYVLSKKNSKRKKKKE